MSHMSHCIIFLTVCAQTVLS